jgi:hypothetical protein
MLLEEADISMASNNEESKFFISVLYGKLPIAVFDLLAPLEEPEQFNSLEHLIDCVKKLDESHWCLYSKKRKDALDGLENQLPSKRFQSGASTSRVGSFRAETSTSKNEGKYCSYHRSTTHSTEECDYLKKNSNGKTVSKPCKICKAPNWKPGHQCESKHVYPRESNSGISSIFVDPNPDDLAVLDEEELVESQSHDVYSIPVVTSDNEKQSLTTINYDGYDVTIDKVIITIENELAPDPPGWSS